MQKQFGNYTFVAANNKQTNEIQELVFSVLEEYGLKKGTMDFCLEDVEKHYFQNRGFFGVLIDENNKIVATGGLFKLDDKRVELRKMYMLPLYRGKGLGKFILEILLGKARELGYERIELATVGVLKEAIALYEKCGFQPFTPPYITSRCDQAFQLTL